MDTWCPLIDRENTWERKTMEYDSAMKKNEVRSFAGKWMELEVSMLSEIS
jgi:hypothetical protein